MSDFKGSRKGKNSLAQGGTGAPKKNATASEASKSKLTGVDKKSKKGY